jgi:hypothetical protein
MLEDSSVHLSHETKIENSIPNLSSVMLVDDLQALGISVPCLFRVTVQRIFFRYIFAFHPINDHFVLTRVHPRFLSHFF